MKANQGNKAGGRPRRLVNAAAEALRERIYAQEPDAWLGSLRDLAQSLGVGIVTVQQVARILEHEGLLEVRRGPGGGYYGRRPDAAVLERSLAAYMRMRPHSWAEALDITSLLFNELCAAAAACADDALHAELATFLPRIEACKGDAGMSVLEQEFQDLLFRMVDRPLFELLTRMTLRFATSLSPRPFYDDPALMAQWRSGRRLVVNAITSRDTELARFEADRGNRRLVLQQFDRLASPS